MRKWMLLCCLCLLSVALLVPAVSMAAITTYAEFKAEMDKMGTKELVIELSGEIDMQAWTACNYTSNYPVTIKGPSASNPAVLTNLSVPLIDRIGSFSTKVTFENIVIKDSDIVGQATDTNRASGAFVGWSYSADLTFKNCKVIDSKIGNDVSETNCGWAGGIYGYMSAHNTGSVLLENCTVSGCTIRAYGSSGGLVGHVSGGVVVPVVITNCVVEDNTIYTADPGRTDKVGDLVGTSGKSEMNIQKFTAYENDVYAENGSEKLAVEQAIGRIGQSNGEVAISGDCYYDGKTMDKWTLVRENGVSQMEFDFSDSSFHVVVPGATSQGPVSHPKTGDSSNLMLWTSLMIVAAIGMVIAGKKRLSAER